MQKKAIALSIAAVAVVGAGLWCSLTSGLLPHQAKNVCSGYLCSGGGPVPVCDSAGQVVATRSRGQAVTYCYLPFTPEPITGAQRPQQGYYQLLSPGALQEGPPRLVPIENVCQTEDQVMQEQQLFVQTPVNLCEADGTTLTPDLVRVGEQLEIVGYDYLDADGSVHLYQVQNADHSGYIRSWYVSPQAEDNIVLVEEKAQALAAQVQINRSRGDPYGGGPAAALDFRPRKAICLERRMPDEVRAFYLGCYPAIIEGIDEYIEAAQSGDINAFVVDIMDNTAVAYASPVVTANSSTAAACAYNTMDAYGAAITKLQEAGFYVIGRITVFNDANYAQDHPEAVICGADGLPLRLAGSYWPSAYCRQVWQYKLDLAVEAVEAFGFDEIQLDYVRFPENSVDCEKNGSADFQNEYGETRSQAVQRFLMYAVDRLHESGVYVSADVFGECAQDYVTAYGQYWPAISNVVDVISGMPYPDHFWSSGSYHAWEHPYDTLYAWSCSVVQRQTETPTPAVVRTWIQAYDSIREPYVPYNVPEVAAEVAGLRDAGLTGGFMTWNSGANIYKYRALLPALSAAQ